MIYTVGHTSQNQDDFYNMLQPFGINCVIDVRSMPYSKYAPQFNKDSLNAYLKNKGILYAHFGKEFGARRNDCLLQKHKDDQNYMQVNFELGAETDDFKAGIRRLKNAILQGRTIALMCTEANPLDCHRFSFISRYLYENGYEISHIVRDKDTHRVLLKTHRELEDCMIKEYVKKGRLWNTGGLFPELNDYEKQRIEAYRLKNNDIGYILSLQNEEQIID